MVEMDGFECCHKEQLTGLSDRSDVGGRKTTVTVLWDEYFGIMTGLEE